MRLRLFAVSRAFFVVRALEFAWMLVAFVIASGLVHLVVRPLGETWSLVGTVYGGAVMLAWYYIGFQYLFVSALVILLGLFLGLLNTTRGFVFVNLLTFVVHSLGVFFIILLGQITLSTCLSIWAMWVSVIVFDCAVPPLICNRFRPK